MNTPALPDSDQGNVPHSGRWQAYLNDCRALLDIAEPMQVSGRITRVAGLVMEAVGIKLAVGSACTIPLPNGSRIEAEVVGFADDKLFLMPQSDVEGIVPGARVYPVEIMQSLPRPGAVTHPRGGGGDEPLEVEPVCVYQQPHERHLVVGFVGDVGQHEDARTRDVRKFATCTNA